MPQRFVDCAVFGCRSLMRQTQGNARSLFVCEKRTRSEWQIGLLWTLPCVYEVSVCKKKNPPEGMGGFGVLAL